MTRKHWPDLDEFDLNDDEYWALQRLGPELPARRRPIRDPEQKRQARKETMQKRRHGKLNDQIH
jgi:hypothetical protein